MHHPTLLCCSLDRSGFCTLIEVRQYCLSKYGVGLGWDQLVVLACYGVHGDGFQTGRRCSAAPLMGLWRLCDPMGTSSVKNLDASDNFSHHSLNVSVILISPTSSRLLFSGADMGDCKKSRWVVPFPTSDYHCPSFVK